MHTIVNCMADRSVITGRRWWRSTLMQLPVRAARTQDLQAMSITDFQVTIRVLLAATE